jgi:hypothetical protein
VKEELEKITHSVGVSCHLRSPFCTVSNCPSLEKVHFGQSLSMKIGVSKTDNKLIIAHLQVNNCSASGYATHIL